MSLSFLSPSAFYLYISFGDQLCPVSSHKAFAAESVLLVDSAQLESLCGYFASICWFALGDLNAVFFFAFVIIFASYKILFSVYFLPIYSKNKLNKLIYLKTECFSRFFCGCTVNFVHCVSVCPTEEHFAFCISF